MHRQRFIATIKNVTKYIHIHTHPQQNQNITTKIKGKKKILYASAKLAKYSTEWTSKDKTRCQFTNKSMKMKLKKYAKRKGNKRKKEYFCKVKQRQIRKIYTNERLTTRGKQQKENQVKK